MHRFQLGVRQCFTVELPFLTIHVQKQASCSSCKLKHTSTTGQRSATKVLTRHKRYTRTPWLMLLRHLRSREYSVVLRSIGVGLFSSALQ